MKRIINITNLNTNEISTIGAGFAGFSISQDNAAVKLAQSAINGIKDNAPFVIDKTKMVLRALSPLLSIAATVTLFVTPKIYSQKYTKLNAHVLSILSKQ